MSLQFADRYAHEPWVDLCMERISNPAYSLRRSNLMDLAISALDDEELCIAATGVSRRDGV